uniref:Uncharacterized protein n=1 Tax=Sphaerodactylus townsendi TaxID=933632 RepID=A0ACB8EZ34_9SAUR
MGPKFRQCPEARFLLPREPSSSSRGRGRTGASHSGFFPACISLWVPCSRSERVGWQKHKPGFQSVPFTYGFFVPRAVSKVEQQGVCPGHHLKGVPFLPATPPAPKYVQSGDAMVLLLQSKFKVLPADKLIENAPLREAVSHLPPFFSQPCADPQHTHAPTGPQESPTSSFLM